MWKHTSLFLLLVGCGYEVPLYELRDEAPTLRDMAVLGLVNDPIVTADELDHGVKLDVRAAHNIIEYRPFSTVAELDEVPYVGPASIDKLYAYAVDHGYMAAYLPPAELVMPVRDDVHFDEAVLRAVLEEVRIGDGDAVVTRAKLRFDDGDRILVHEELLSAAYDCRDDIYTIDGFRFAESHVQAILEAFDLEDRLALLAAGTNHDADANRYLELTELERARLDL